MSIVSTQANDWKYLSEGGATIVFSYAGAPHPVFSGRVLRIRKSRRPSSADADQTSGIHGQDDDNPPSTRTSSRSDCESESSSSSALFLEFQSKVISRFIDPRYLASSLAVEVESTWLQELVSLHEASRPEVRRLADGIDTTCTTAVLTEDLIGGEDFAIEIKPKWGFLPSPTHLSPHSREIKTNTCRFCMHTYVRGQTDLTSYCPLDLYSGEPRRIRLALDVLMKGWVASDAKLNNFRLFKSGKFVVPSEDNFDRDFVLNRVHSALVVSPILRIISRYQRALDTFDIEGLVRLWESVHPSDEIGKQEREPSMHEWASFAQEALRSLADSSDVPAPLPFDARHLRHHLLAYALSATFKDCSIIIGFLSQENQSPDHRAELPRVSVIDLDIKSLNRLGAWRELDKRIVDTYAQLPANKRKQCRMY